MTTTLSMPKNFDASLPPASILSDLDRPPRLVESESTNISCSELNGDWELIRQICLRLASPVKLQSVYGRCEKGTRDAPQSICLVPEAVNSKVNSPARVLDGACRVALQTGKIEVQKQASPDRCLIAVPLKSSTHGTIAIGLCIETELPKISLQWLGNAIVSEYESATATARKVELDVENHEIAAVIDLLEDAVEAKNLRDACMRIANRLQSLARGSCVAIGYRSTKNSSCRLMAISGIASFDRQSSMSISLASMMLQVMEKTGPTIFTKESPCFTDQLRDDRASALDFEGRTMLGCPLLGQDGHAVGALVLIEPEETFDHERRTAFLKAASPSIACALSATARYEQSIVHSMLRTFCSSWSRHQRTAFAAVAVLASVALAWPMTYRISSPSIVEPIHRRIVTAPFDGTLERALVKPGEMVRKGDPIAKMDDREIHWKHAGVLADQKQAQKKRDAAQAAHNYADQQIAQLEIDRLAIELNLLDDRATHLDIVSPIDGIVTSGDLARVEGAPLTTGQSLFEIAPMDRMMAEVSIVDHEIAYVAVGQDVTVDLAAYPDETWKGRISKIRPRAEIRDHTNVFIAEVELDNASQRLRPGMKGDARIYSAKRPYAWILFHHPWDYLVKHLTW